MISNRNSIRKSVSFGEKQEHTFDNNLSKEERRASWYSSQQYEAMRGQAFGLAKTAVLLGDKEDVEKLQGDSLRGLEKVMNYNAMNVKRRHNILRSIVELHQMKTQGMPQHEKADHIKATLERYVQKHQEKAKKAARARALGDEREAHIVYREACGDPTRCSAISA